MDGGRNNTTKDDTKRKYGRKRFADIKNESNTKKKSSGINE